MREGRTRPSFPFFFLPVVVVYLGPHTQSLLISDELEDERPVCFIETSP